MPVPPQHKVAEVIDFRNAMLGPRGYRMARKRTIEEREEQVIFCAITNDNKIAVLTASSPHARGLSTSASQARHANSDVVREVTLQRSHLCSRLRLKQV